jgi:LPS-assembly protein
VLGSKAHLELKPQSGHIEQVYYRIMLVNEAAINQYLQPLNQETNRLNALTAWGSAKRAIEIDRYRSEYWYANYTTCAPTNPEWQIAARSIHLDKITGRGQARDAELRVEGVPILYTPYLDFPIDKRRKTGFLTPVIGYNSGSGLTLGLPFYWNIAPNYDATIQPTIITKRGLWTKALFRYLTPFSAGAINGSVIPNDHAFRKFKENAKKNPQFNTQPSLSRLLNDSDTRYGYGIIDHTQFNPHLSSAIDFATASDDYYYQDFGVVPEILTVNQLLQQANITYASEHWELTGAVEHYYTLHPVNKPPVTNLYGRLPEFEAQGNYPDILGGFDFTFGTQDTYFERDKNPGELITPVRGGRFLVMPGLSYPMYWPFAYITPRVQFQATDYTLDQQIRVFKSSIQRTLPIIDFDSGLFFDRAVAIHDHDYDQTLEPRLYYLYVPFRNQREIPVFDSGIIPFTYNSLFLNNRFSGYDRIGDTNQVSLALTSRFIDQETGLEKFSASIGRIFYFRDRRVTLCDPTTVGCSDPLTGIGSAPNDESASPIASTASYHFNPTWSLNGDMAYDPHFRGTDTADIYVQFKPNDRYLLNLGYNFLRNGDIISTEPPGGSKNNLNQATISYAFPITEQWSTVGVFNYNMSHHYPQTYLFGLQYDSCCFALRAVGGRTFATLKPDGGARFSNAVYFQLLLKGLTDFDPNNVAGLLSSRIPGYHDPFLATKTFI